MIAILSAFHQGIVGALSILFMYAAYYGVRGIVRLVKNPKRIKNASSKLKSTPLPEQEDKTSSLREEKDFSGDYTYTTTYSSIEPTTKKREGVKQKKSIASIVGYVMGVILLLCISFFVTKLNQRENHYVESTKSIRFLSGTCYSDDKMLFGESSLSRYIMEDPWGAAMDFRMYDNTERLRNSIYSYATQNSGRRLYKVPYLKDRYYTDIWGKPRGFDFDGECETIDIDKHPSLQGKQVIAFKTSEPIQSITGITSRPCYKILIVEPENKPNSRIFLLTALGINESVACNHAAHMLYDYPLCNMSGYELRKDNKMPDNICTIIICICSLLFALMTILFFKKK